MWPRHVAFLVFYLATFKGVIFCEKRLGKDHRIYWEKAYKIERQDIFQTLDETKNHSQKLTVTFRTGTAF